METKEQNFCPICGTYDAGLPIGKHHCGEKFLVRHDSGKAAYEKRLISGDIENSQRQPYRLFEGLRFCSQILEMNN